jgi:hypothetical protein
VTKPRALICYTAHAVVKFADSSDADAADKQYIICIGLDLLEDEANDNYGDLRFFLRTRYMVHTTTLEVYPYTTAQVLQDLLILHNSR